MAIPRLDQQEKTKPILENKGKIIVFTCNWQAYHRLESAGREHQAFPKNVFPIRVMCLGQISPGIILKSLEKGAAGILLLGCPQSECHFKFGIQKAEEVYQQVKQLTTLLGYRDEQVQLDWVTGGTGDSFLAKVQAFVEALSNQEGL